MIGDFGEIESDSDNPEENEQPNQAPEPEPELTLASRMERNLSVVEVTELKKAETAEKALKYAQYATAALTVVAPPVGIAAEAVRSACSQCVTVIKYCEKLVNILQGNPTDTNKAKEIFNNLNTKVALLASIIATLDENYEVPEEKQKFLETALRQCELTVVSTDNNLKIVHAKLSDQRTKVQNIKDFLTGRLTKIREKIEESYTKMKECIDNLNMTMQAATADDLRDVKKLLEKFARDVENWQAQCRRLWEEALQLVEINAELVQNFNNVSRQNARLEQEKGLLARQNGILEGRVEATQAQVEEKQAEVREKAAEVREKAATVREKAAEVREKEAEVREKQIDLERERDNLKKASARLKKTETELKTSEASKKELKHTVLKALYEMNPIMNPEDKSRLEMALFMEKNDIIVEIVKKYAKMNCEEQNKIIINLRRFGIKIATYSTTVVTEEVQKMMTHPEAGHCSALKLIRGVSECLAPLSHFTA